MALANIEYSFLLNLSNTVNVIPKNKSNELFKVALSVIKISEKTPANRIIKFFIKGGKVKLESLGAEKNLNKKDLRETKKYEINRIFIFKTENNRTNRCIKKALKQFQSTSTIKLT